MEKRNTRFYGLDFVKVVAIVWIALYHVLDFQFGWRLGGLFGSGDYWSFFSAEESFLALVKILLSVGVVGVNLFVIASGFSLVLSVSRRELSFVDFIKKRIFRIFPYYWLILSLLFIVDLILGKPINFIDYFVHFFGINNFFPQYVLSISAPFWFVGTIVQLYLLFPLLFRLSKRPLLLIVLAVFFKVFLDPFLLDLFNGGRFFTEFIIEFCVGILLGNYFLKSERMPVSSNVFLFIATFAALVSFVSFGFFGTNVPFYLIYQVFGVLLFLFLFNLGEKLPIKSLRYLSYLSILSFPVFLTHYSIITNLFVKFDDYFSLRFELLASVFVFFSIAMVLDKVIKCISGLKSFFN